MTTAIAPCSETSEAVAFAELAAAFNPTCQHVEPGAVPTECGAPAVWLGTAPCGDQAYFCDPHHHDQRTFTCNSCGAGNLRLADWKWTPL